MPAPTLTEAKSITGSFTAEAFAAHLTAQKSAPAWWLDRKRAAYAKFASLPMPKRTDESWRFSNIGTLTLDGFALPAAANLKSHIPDLKVANAAALTFVDSRLSTRTAIAPDLAAKGVIVTTLTEAVVKHADLLKAHFMAQPQKLGSEKFASLHIAFLSDGAFVYIPRGVTLDAPIVITHAASGTGSAVFPHTLVIAEENSKATIVDYFVSVSDDPQSA